MDEGGYDAVWLANTINTTRLSPVTLMGTQVAALTRRLRIGTAVTLAGFYHPLRLAEELALLDIFSGGRLNWGAGRGFDPTEMRVFGVQPEESAERYREAVDIVLAAWSGDRFTHRGKNWQFEDVEVLPKPRQRPRPPVGPAATSPESIVKAPRIIHHLDGRTLPDQIAKQRSTGNARGQWPRWRAATSPPGCWQSRPLMRRRGSLRAPGRPDRGVIRAAKGTKYIGGEEVGEGTRSGYGGAW
jgi:hypothetical protein